jgi:hypothetical protein
LYRRTCALLLLLLLLPLLLLLVVLPLALALSWWLVARWVAPSDGRARALVGVARP